jgi:hypothetical protein
MRLIDPNHPFFARPWVRWVSVAVPALWGAVEFLWVGDPFWGLLFLGVGGLAFWELILRGPDRE